MFRQLTAFLLLLVFATHLLRQPFILLDYYANSAAYAKSCINKARPQMHCNGKCQVMKKIQELEKKVPQGTARKIEIKMAVLSSQSFYCIITTPLLDDDKLIPYTFPRRVLDISIDFFHPPQAVDFLLMNC